MLLSVAQVDPYPLVSSIIDKNAMAVRGWTNLTQPPLPVLDAVKKYSESN